MYCTEQEIRFQKRLGSKGGRKKRNKEKRKERKLAGAVQSGGKSDVIMVSNMHNFQIGVANMPPHHQRDFQDDQLSQHMESSLERHQKFNRGSGKDFSSNQNHRMNPAASSGFNNHQPLSRIELERKRNSGYDQKFLFKKNFISKYQPNLNQVQNHQPQSHMLQPKSN